MKFKVGDLAITQNSNVPLMNNNLLVVVLKVQPGHKTIKWPCDYYIKRVDGQPFGWITGATGEDLVFSRCECWCRADQLRKPDEAGLKEDTEIQQRQPDECDMALFNFYEQAITRLSM